ncbi:MAG: hypothetical protein KJ052_00190 [Candidatus Hydrogenedentes bacterium]|nr:hypothetical protein [Candidatus Hydrogenedentota bacterium]
MITLAGCPVSLTGLMGWTYPITDYSRGDMVQLAPDGGYLVVGRAGNVDGGGNTRMLAARIASNGDLMASAVFDGLYQGTGATRCGVGSIDDSGIITLAGVDHTDDFPSISVNPPGRLRIIQTDSLFNTLLDRTYGEDIQWRVETVLGAPDGSVYLGGVQKFRTSNPERNFILKLEANGEVVVLGEYGDRASDRSSLLRWVGDSSFATNGDIVLTGYKSAADFDMYKTDFALLRIRTDGSMVWLKSFEKPGSQEAYALTALPGGSFLLAGKSDEKTPTDRYPYLIKADADGNEVWARDDILGFEPVRSDYEIWDMAVDTDGSIVIVGQGRTISYPGGIGVLPVEGRDSFIIKLDSYGNNIWTKSLDPAYLYGVCLTDHGTYMTVGTVTDNLTLIEVDRNGNVVN